MFDFHLEFLCNSELETNGDMIEPNEVLTPELDHKIGIPLVVHNIYYNTEGNSNHLYKVCFHHLRYPHDWNNKKENKL